jgi:hypothetical protein
LQASGGHQYLWQSSDGSFSSTDPNPTVSPLDTTLYRIAVTETNGCIYEDSVQLNVIPLISVEFELKREGDCIGLPSVHVENKTDSLWQTDEMLFDFGDGTTSDAEQVEHEYEEEGVYTVKLIGARQGGDALCVAEQAVSIPIYSLFIPNVITPSDEDALNDVFFIQYGDTSGASPADFDLKTSVVIYNRWGGKVFEDPDYQYNWRGDNVNSGIYYFEVTVQGRATCKGWLQIMK